MHTIPPIFSQIIASTPPRHVCYFRPDPPCEVSPSPHHRVHSQHIVSFSDSDRPTRNEHSQDSEHPKHTEHTEHTEHTHLAASRPPRQDEAESQVGGFRPPQAGPTVHRR
jgi:hypothetical protein